MATAGTRVAGLARLSGTLPHAKAMLGCARPVAVDTSFLVLQSVRSCPRLIVCRYTGFFNRLTANDLWQGMTGVSNAGRKRGRGRRLGQRKVDLNKGQKIGEGASNTVWPGLNAPVIKGKELVKMKKLPADPQRREKLAEARDSKTKFRSFKIPPLQRGWSGTKFPGTSVGAPDPVGDYTFDGFDTRVLEFKLVSNMTGNLGRKERFSAFVVTGNMNGLAGYALAKAPNAKACIRKAKNMAGQRLQYVERYQNHTIYHNFHSKEEKTSIIVKKAAEGHGLVCHRALKTICEVIGIKDLYAKVEGSRGNIQNLTKAFFDGLKKQETHQDLADRLKLNLVELRPERGNFPVVVAAPKDEVSTVGVREEVVDFENLYFKGRIPLMRLRPRPFWERQKHWHRKWSQLHRLRNQHSSQRERIVLGFEPSSKEKAIRQKPLKASRD